MYHHLTLIQQDGHHYMDSREVAELIGKRHDHLLRDIRNYISVIEKQGLPKVGVSDFFIKSSFVNSQNKVMPCYLISKSGAEIIANKLTGEKGVLFTIAYVSKFNEMDSRLRAEREQELRSKPTIDQSSDTIQILFSQLNRINTSTAEIINFLNNLPEPLVLTDGEEFRDIPHTYTASQMARIFGMYSLYGNLHAQAVSCILNENLFITEPHKIIVNYEDGLPNRFRYDEYALQEVSDWLEGHQYPNAIYGFDHTYHVVYSTNKNNRHKRS